MKSKIDYHVLTMDEIIFDNRNKDYGAFRVRQLYESNLTKAMLMTASIFLISMCTPALLKGLGWLVEKPADIINTTILTTEVFDVINPITPPESPKVNKPTPSSLPDEREYQVVKAKDLPKDPVIPTRDPVVPTTFPNGPSTPGGTGDPGGSGSGGNPEGIITPAKPAVFNPDNVQEMPEFIGGQNAFQEFVDENIVYPVDEKIDEVEGTTRVEFIVQEDGSVSKVRIYKSSGNTNLDKEAVRLVRSLPKYKPGRHNGVPVKVLCILPIEFSIR